MHRDVRRGTYVTASKASHGYGSSHAWSLCLPCPGDCSTKGVQTLLCHSPEGTGGLSVPVQPPLEPRSTTSHGPGAPFQLSLGLLVFTHRCCRGAHLQPWPWPCLLGGSLKPTLESCLLPHVLLLLNGLSGQHLDLLLTCLI